MSHTDKLVDGIPIKYLCQPCPECKAKLEMGKEMAGSLRRLLDMVERGFIPHEKHLDDQGSYVEGWNDAEIALRDTFTFRDAQITLAAWEKAWKGGT